MPFLLVYLHRPDRGQFDIIDFDPNLCSHGLYGFADIDSNTWKVIPSDSW